MLLNFRFKNIRSFRDDTIFTLIPSSQKTHKDYIIIAENGNNIIKALPAAVIYGANASGKSNTILGMYTFKKIIESGEINTPKVSSIIDILPFIHDESFTSPIEMEITFLQSQNVYRYYLSIQTVFEAKQIVGESLYINDNEIFTRTIQNGVNMPIHELVRKKYIQLDGSNEDFYFTLLSKLDKTLNQYTLFLTSNLVTFIGTYVYDMLSWFEKFHVVMNADDISFRQKDLKVIKGINGLGKQLSNREFYESNTVTEILKYAEFGNQKIEFLSDTNDFEMVSLYNIQTPLSKDFKTDIIIESRVMESKGTIQLIKLIQPIIDALKEGGIIVLDEMDSSLHFEIVVSLLRIFNDRTLNKKGAQLVFNSHNPIYLDGDLLRHDQIYMVTKDKETLTSELYALSDFKLRPEERILKNYLNGKYGSLPHMDLEIAVKNILESETI